MKNIFRGSRKNGLIFTLAVLLFQLYTAFSSTEFLLGQLTASAYYTMVAVGLCLLMGYAGQISIGHAGFFAIGAYGCAFFTTFNLLEWRESLAVNIAESCGLLQLGEDLYGDPLLIVSPFFSLTLSLILAAAAAWLLGRAVLHLKGHYLAMATLGFGLIVYRLLLASETLGESDGLSDLPALPLFPGLTVSGDFDAVVSNYYISMAMLLLTLLFATNLIASRTGRALRAVHGSEEAALSMGVDVARYKLQTFIFSAVVAACAGAFLAYYNGGVGPDEATVMKSVRYVAIVAVGGMTNLYGTALLSLLLNFLSMRGCFGSYDDAIFGLILVVVMLWAPGGIFSLLNRKISGFRLKKEEKLNAQG